MSAFRSKPRGAESGQMPRQARRMAASALEAALSSIAIADPLFAAGEALSDPDA